MTHPPDTEALATKIDFDLWRRIFRFALNHKRLLLPLMASALVLSLIDAAFPIVTMKAIDVVQNGGVPKDLIPIAGAYFGLALTLAALVYVFIRCAGGISHHIAFDIKRDCFKRLQELEFSFYDKQPTGWLISRLTADCDRLSRILAWGFLDILWGSFFVAAMSITMLILHWKLALIVLATLLPLLAISIYFQKKMLITSRQIRKHNARITASYNEGIAGVKTTKTLGRETENLSEFEGMSTDMYSASVRRAFFSAIYLPIVMLIGSLGSGLALWYGGLNVLSGSISLGILVAFISYAGNFFQPINQIAQILAEIQGAQAAGERVMGLLATEPKIKDSPEVLQKIATRSAELQPAEGAQNQTTIAPDGHPHQIDEIQFADVSFSYNDKEQILKRFNLTVKRGQTIALVGPSGGGKSTIVSLVSRFYEPTSGEIRINGLDYRQRSLAWLQSQLGNVLQTPHLFNGSVIENIRYGRLGATDQEIREAATLVNAHDFIMKLENGYGTPIGEGGARLSTGERQLISFARALLADPQIFIMDEATSSIDTETEKLIQDGMQRVFDGRISFVIAHRLSTIRSADQILVIQKGEIEEQGTHQELLAQRGHYYELYVNQFRREGEEQALEAG
ncbi:ABC transporter ATP-binding protein [Pelagicoccus sp. SDUM812005]|uniref:ABC transporter ATP-binding protein n=1 Tax=Pelagicoccus sp. SDUM812005 TaxID=3041257 RepID=UPI00280FF1C3|nr:ABC transporter ATP-binding protein [Pelagicoccus sp. SDUM812005]MDQ8180017.1 ABC transporter ATP-binding protein [Pelagicoccus sp. SDUM812005]